MVVQNFRFSSRIQQHLQHLEILLMQRWRNFHLGELVVPGNLLSLLQNNALGKGIFNRNTGQGLTISFSGTAVRCLV